MDNLEGGLEDCKQYYSPEWVNFLKQLLVEDPKERPDPLSIFRSNHGTLYIKMVHKEYD